MTKIVLQAAADLRGRDTMDLVFTPRDYPAVNKWIKCLRSIEGRSPWKWGYTASLKDLPKIEQRIKHSVLNSDLKDTYLKNYIVDGDISVTQDVVNSIHRFVEDHKKDAAWHLDLHVDIHHWEGIVNSTIKDVIGSRRKIIWNPPGIYIPYDDIDYDQYTTQSCSNFLHHDFAHVGRDPFNSFTFRDDLSMETSCVIQHSVTAGFNWVWYDDSILYTNKEKEFRKWVDDNMWFFSKAGIKNSYDKKLSFGRMILADGDEDWTKIDPKYEFILRVDVRS